MGRPLLRHRSPASPASHLTSIFAAAALLVAYAQPTHATLPPAAATPWYRIESANFTCFTNGNPDKVSKLLRDLERLNETLLRTAPVLQKRRSVPTYIVVFQDSESFRPYNRQIEAKESLPVGFFTGGEDVGYLVIGEAGTDDAKDTVYHEFIHSVLYASVPNAPLWLHEGLAEVYGNFSSGSRSGEVGKTRENYVYWLQNNDWMQVRSLFAVEQDDPRYGHSGRNLVFYLESWALVHMLAVPEKSAGRFESFMAGLSYGKHPGITFQEVYGAAAFDSVEKSLKEYVRNDKFINSRKYRFTEEFEKSPITAHALTQKEALCRLGDMLLRRGEPLVSQAEAHFLAAERQDASYAPAVTGLAMTAEAKEEQEEATRLYAKAVELDPSSAYALFHAGRQLLGTTLARAAQSGPSGAPEGMRQAREYLTRSLAVDPDRPYALLALAKTYIFETSDAVEPGIEAAKRSVAEMPGRADGWLTLMGLEASAGRPEEARRVFEEHLVPLGNRRGIAAGREMLAELDGK